MGTPGEAESYRLRSGVHCEKYAFCRRGLSCRVKCVGRYEYRVVFVLWVVVSVDVLRNFEVRVSWEVLFWL